MHAAGFNAATDGGVQAHGSAEASAGISGMVWVDAYNNSTCAQTMTNSAIAAMVQANVSAGSTGLRYQIGDEPTANGCNAAPVYTSITQAVHGADPSAKTWVADDQFQVGNAVQQGVPMNGSVDILAFDVYPCESGACDYSAIDSAVQQIHAAGVTNWEFIIQDFNSSPWRWPSPSEIQAQFDHWMNQGAIGYWVFAWDYLGQQVAAQAGNVAALQQINSGAINGSSPPSASPPPASPTAVPTSNPPAAGGHATPPAGTSGGATPAAGSGSAAGASPTPTTEPTPSGEPSASPQESPPATGGNAAKTTAGSGTSPGDNGGLGLVLLGSALASGLGGVVFLAWRQRRRVG